MVVYWGGSAASELAEPSLFWLIAAVFRIILRVCGFDGILKIGKELISHLLRKAIDNPASELCQFPADFRLHVVSQYGPLIGTFDFDVGPPFGKPCGSTFAS